MKIDMYQGDDAQGRKFGYVAGDEGGYFFTWMGDLDTTVETLEVDEVDGDGGLDAAEVATYLRSKIAGKF
jgi:hypothetical protein